MNILDPRFKYTNSVATDVRKTFARIRREQERQRAAQAVSKSARVVNLTPSDKRRVG